jgi:hypothetical protein
MPNVFIYVCNIIEGKIVNLLRKCLDINSKIIVKERECKNIEAKIEVNKIMEDQTVHEVSLENELEILECMQKRRELNRDSLWNNIKELSATADTLRNKIIELDRQIEYLQHKYGSMILAPKIEYTVKETVEDRITFRKILQKFDNSVDKNANVGKVVMLTL